MALSIGDVNRMDEGEFLRAFGDVAEHSPWVAGAAARDRPFRGREAMIEAFERAVSQAPREARLTLLRAHPDLAGRAAVAGGLTEESRREQAGAGLGALTPDEFARFTDLNERYRERFGFPFILAVKGAGKRQILDAFGARIENGPEQEFDTALAQVLRILRFRLEERVMA